MEKKTVKAVTRKQKYLAAIAGDGVAPSPITSDEKLMYNIAEKMNNGGGSGGGMIYVDMVSPFDNDPALLEQMMSDLRNGSEKIYYTIHDGMLAPVLGFERSIGGASKFGGAKADVVFISSDGMVKKTKFEIDAETYKSTIDEFYFTGLTKAE